MHEFGLGSVYLEVQAPQGSPGGIGQIVLDKSAADTCLGISLRLEGFGEKPPFVRVDIRLDNYQPFNIGINSSHGWIVSRLVVI